MTQREIAIGIALEEACLTLDQVAAACAVEAAWLARLVDEGYLPPTAGSAPEWRFGSAALRRARRMREIERAFDATPELAALVADMLEEMDELRAQLRRRSP
jgi:chaperone modulatory protein CbpM